MVFAADGHADKARDFHRRNSVRPHSGHEETISKATVASDIDLFDEAEYRKFLVRRAMRLMQTEFRDQSWQACWKHVVGWATTKNTVRTGLRTVDLRKYLFRF